MVGRHPFGRDPEGLLERRHGPGMQTGHDQVVDVAGRQPGLVRARPRTRRGPGGRRPPHRTGPPTDVIRSRRGPANARGTRRWRRPGRAARPPPRRGRRRRPPHRRRPGSRRGCPGRPVRRSASTARAGARAPASCGQLDGGPCPSAPIRTGRRRRRRGASPGRRARWWRWSCPGRPGPAWRNRGCSGSGAPGTPRARRPASTAIDVVSSS